MSSKSSKSSKSAGTPATPVATPVQIALASMLPLFCALQERTTENVALGTSRSAGIVAAIGTLHKTSTDFAADRVALLGDANKGTKRADGTKGALVEALSAKYGANSLHVSVRNECAWARIVCENWNVPAVREAAEKSGLRKARDVAKPKAKPETSATPPSVEKPYSQSEAVEFVAAHFDDVVYAMRAYLLRAADSIGIAKLGELEVHLSSKTRKTS